jgi:hypothetical protein
MSLEELVKHFSITDGEFTVDDTRMVHAQDGVHVLHTLCSDVGELFDLGGSILDLFPELKFKG